MQELIIERTRDVLKHSIYLMREAKKVIQTPNDQNKLSIIAHDLSSSLNACISTMPSQHCLDEVIKQMSEYIYTLSGPFDRKQPLPSITSDGINRAAANLNQATTDLVVSTHTGGTNDLVNTSARFSRAFGDFIDNGIDFINHQQEDEKRSRLIISLKNVHSSSNQLLERAKSISFEPTTNENDMKYQLANAAG